MARVEFTIESPLSAEEVFAGLVDFSAQRPQLWPAIDPGVYAVHDAGDGWAEATEGSDVMGGIWARERYDWSHRRVRATVVESNFWHPGGTWEATISPADGGGSRVAVVRDRRARTAKARVLEAMMRFVGARILARQLVEAPAVSGAKTA